MNGTNTTPHDTGHSHVVAFERRLGASVDRVWYAWSDAEQLEHWFTEHAEQDFRVGGRYRNSDGDEGEFLEIDPKKRIRFTWEQPDYAQGGIVTVDFTPDGDEATLVRIEHAGIGCNDTEDLEIGWTWSLDSLVAFIDNGLGLRFEDWARGEER